MKKAGKAVCDAVVKNTRKDDLIMVLAGKGKNGGDAIYCA